MPAASNTPVRVMKQAEALPDLRATMASLPSKTTLLEQAKTATDEDVVVSNGEDEAVWDCAHDSPLLDENCVSFPLSQPDLPSRQHTPLPSVSVQRRRRSAVFYSKPYADMHQDMSSCGAYSARGGSAVRLLPFVAP